MMRMPITLKFGVDPDFKQSKANLRLEKVLDSLEKDWVRPNADLYAALLKHCGEIKCLLKGARVHQHIVKTKHDRDKLLANLTIEMYGKCRSLEDAKAVFDKMQHRRNVFSWTILIAAYIEHGLDYEAVNLFGKMELEHVEADKFAFSTVLSAISSPALFAEGKYLHAKVMSKMLRLDIVIENALITMYGRCGCVGDASKLFYHIYNNPDTVSWSAMITVYAQNGYDELALQCFKEMHLNGMSLNKYSFISSLDACANLAALQFGTGLHGQVVYNGFESDVDVANAILNMYGKCGSLSNARAVFDNIKKKDLFSWNSIIAAYSQQGLVLETLEFANMMRCHGMWPNDITFLSILSACSHGGFMEVAYHYFVAISFDCDLAPRIKHYGCMIDSLGRAGWIDEAGDFTMSMAFQPSIMIWRTLLGACRIYSNVEEGKHAAHHLFQLIPGDLSSLVLLSNIYAETGL